MEHPQNSIYKKANDLFLQIFKIAIRKHDTIYDGFLVLRKIHPITAFAFIKYVTFEIYIIKNAITAQICENCNIIHLCNNNSISHMQNLSRTGA